MDPTIVNAKPRYRPAALVEPPGFGYLLLSADVEPPTGRRPFPNSSAIKTALLGRLKSAAADLARSTLWSGPRCTEPCWHHPRPGMPARSSTRRGST